MIFSEAKVIGLTQNLDFYILDQDLQESAQQLFEKGVQEKKDLEKDNLGELRDPQVFKKSEKSLLK